MHHLPPTTTAGTVMREGDSDFRIQPGRIRSTKAPKAKGFVNQVLAAAKRAGHTSGSAPSGKPGRRLGHSTFGRGRNVFGRSRIFPRIAASSSRRVSPAIRGGHSVQHRSPLMSRISSVRESAEMARKA